VLGLLPATAWASAAPYSDPNAVGYLGFCNAKNQQITSGSITSYPFVDKAVSSKPAPSHYGPPPGRAVLYVYQPIQYVDPSNWSGKQLTAATAYTNPKAPMAVGTKLDPSMVNFSAVFPLHFQGFAQIRMYFTAPGQTPFSTTYPAADIKVSGSTWTQVGGGKVNCAAGQARSNEIAIGAPTTFPNKTPGKTSGTATSGASGSKPTSGSTTDSGVATSAAGQATHHSSDSGSGGLIAVVTALAVLAIGGGAWVAIRRRSRTVG